MTKNEHYKLCLKEFDVNLSRSWKELREDVDFCDVTLACEDNQISAHKVILSACSPIFKTLLKRNPHQNPLLYLRGVRYAHLVNLLDFIYTGEAKITSDELDIFLNMAHDLQVKGLTEEGQEIEELSKDDKMTISQKLERKPEVPKEILSDIKEPKEHFDDIFVTEHHSDVEEPSPINKSIEFALSQVEPLLKSDDNQTFSPKRKLSPVFVSRNSKSKIKRTQKSPEQLKPDDNIQNYTNYSYRNGYSNPDDSEMQDVNHYSDYQNPDGNQVQTDINHLYKVATNYFSQQNSQLQNGDSQTEMDVEKETEEQGIGNYIIPENKIPNNVDHEKEVQNETPTFFYQENYATQQVQNVNEMEPMVWGNYIGQGNDFKNYVHQEEAIQIEKKQENNIKKVHDSDFNAIEPVSWVPKVKSENAKDYGKAPSYENFGQSIADYSLNNENICKKCNLTFSSKMNLDEHVKCMHDGGESFVKNREENKTKNDTKSKITKSEQPRIKSEPSKIKSEPPNIKSEVVLKSCDKCDFITTQTNVLSNHKKTVHEGIGFPCEKCNFNGTQRSSLSRHILSVHEKVRYSCELCPYSATQKAILTKHLKVKH